MNTIVFDCETTTHNKGNPYDTRNRLVNLGYSVNESPVSIFYLGDSNGLGVFRGNRQNACLYVGFNLKFDLAWIRREFGICVRHEDRVWDCQLAFYIMTNQTNPFPSLNQVAEHYGLGTKLDVVKTEYWEKGIDTDQVPREILDEYLTRDVELTYQIYLKQQEELESNPKLKKLINLACMDLVVLQEMEWNGLKYDVENSVRLGNENLDRLGVIDTSLYDLSGISSINFASGDHLSALLYGGVIREEVKEDYLFTYKSAKKSPVVKQRKVIKEHPMPRLVEPLRRSELKKEGYWATNEPTLRQLKATGRAKKIIDLILERAKLEKLVGTYYHGLPELIKKMEWQDNILHASYNQCAAVTGRLSSTKPNGQNLSSEIKDLIVTRY